MPRAFETSLVLFAHASSNSQVFCADHRTFRIRCALGHRLCGFKTYSRPCCASVVFRYSLPTCDGVHVSGGLVATSALAEPTAGVSCKCDGRVHACTLPLPILLGG